MDEPRRRYGGMLSGLDIHYHLGAGHPLLGRRMPDLDVITATARWVFSLLHTARPVLLNLGEPGALDIAPWADRVQHVDARYTGAWELPVLGAVVAPAAALIRPDGHVAWVGDGSDEGSATPRPPGSDRPAPAEPILAGSCAPAAQEPASRPDRAPWVRRRRARSMAG